MAKKEFSGCLGFTVPLQIVISQKYALSCFLEIVADRLRDSLPALTGMQTRGGLAIVS